MTNLERNSSTTSSDSVGRWAISTVIPLRAHPLFDGLETARTMSSLSDGGCCSVVRAKPASRGEADDPVLHPATAVSRPRRAATVGGVPGGGSPPGCLLLRVVLDDELLLDR